MILRQKHHCIGKTASNTLTSITMPPFNLAKTTTFLDHPAKITQPITFLVREQSSED